MNYARGSASNPSPEVNSRCGHPVRGALAHARRAGPDTQHRIVSVWPGGTRSGHPSGCGTPARLVASKFRFAAFAGRFRTRRKTRPVGANSGRRRAPPHCAGSQFRRRGIPTEPVRDVGRREERCYGARRACGLEMQFRKPFDRCERSRECKLALPGGEGRCPRAPRPQAVWNQRRGENFLLRKSPAGKYARADGCDGVGWPA